MSKYEVYYDTVGAMLSQIAAGQKEHDFAIIPDLVYDGWKQLSSFRGEEKKTIISVDNVERELITATFVDDGCDWKISIINCMHPNAKMGDDWRFIVRILKNEKEISHSRMGTEDFFAYVAHKRA